MKEKNIIEKEKMVAAIVRFLLAKLMERKRRVGEVLIAFSEDNNRYKIALKEYNLYCTELCPDGSHLYELFVTKQLCRLFATLAEWEELCKANPYLNDCAPNITELFAHYSRRYK